MLRATKVLEETVVKAATMGGIMGHQSQGVFPGRIIKYSAAVIRVSAGICGLQKKSFFMDMEIDITGTGLRPCWNPFLKARICLRCFMARQVGRAIFT